MRLTVYRGAGDRQGTDIDVPLLSGRAALIERGRAELNDRAHARDVVTVKALPKAGLLPGRLVQAHPPGKPPWNARITSVTFTADGMKSLAIIGLERPL